MQKLLTVLLLACAAAFSLTLIALFPQDRWSFFVVLSAFVGFCAYLTWRIL